MSKDRKDLCCLYCGHEMAHFETNWREGKRRCPSCNDSKLKEIKSSKTIDTYPKDDADTRKEWAAKKETVNKPSLEIEVKKETKDEDDAMSSINLWDYD